MADGLVPLENSAILLTDSKAFSEGSNCVKCLNLETQLHEALKELSSAQLIIEMRINQVHLLSKLIPTRAYFHR
jgi:hypothetical protein